MICKHYYAMLYSAVFLVLILRDEMYFLHLYRKRRDIINIRTSSCKTWVFLQTFLWQRATLATGDWFADRAWKNHKKWRN